MPLLGVGHVMTLVVRPTVRSIGVPMLVAVSDAMEAVIVSTQGFVISLPYCFLNSEVQGAVRSHWSRWRMVRYQISLPSISYWSQLTLSVN